MSKSIKLESPLHYFHATLNRKPEPVKNSAGALFNDEAEYGLVVKEARLSAHLNLRGNASNTNFCTAVTEALGLMLPLTPGTYQRSGNTSIYWLGPSEWLVVEIDGDTQELEARLLTGPAVIIPN